MDVGAMYEDFRIQFPEWAKAADAKHMDIMGHVDPEGAVLWFESLAGVINSRMGAVDRRGEIAAIFQFFNRNFGIGSEDLRNCLDASFVENLFWEVHPDSAAAVWATLPKSLQQLYVAFHGRSPT